MQEPHLAKRATRRAALRAAAGAGLGLGAGALARALAPLALLGAAAAAEPDMGPSMSGEGEETLEVPGAALRLEFLEGFDAGLRAATRNALRVAALAVAAYFGGRFPVPAARLRLVAIEG